MSLSIGDRITLNKVRYSVYDLDELGNYICLRCVHAYLVDRKCANCGAKKLANKYSEGDYGKEYKEPGLKKVLAMLGE